MKRSLKKKNKQEKIEPASFIGFSFMRDDASYAGLFIKAKHRDFSGSTFATFSINTYRKFVEELNCLLTSAEIDQATYATRLEGGQTSNGVSVRETYLLLRIYKSEEKYAIHLECIEAPNPQCSREEAPSFKHTYKVSRSKIKNLKEGFDEMLQGKIYQIMLNLT